MAAKRRKKNGQFVKGSGGRKKARKRVAGGKTRARAKRPARRAAGGLEARVTRLEKNLHAVEHTTVAVVNQFLGAAGRKKIHHVPGYTTPTGRKLGHHKTMSLGPGR